MATFNIRRTVNQATLKLGLWAYRRPATRRAYIAAADAVSGGIKWMSGTYHKYYYNNGYVRSEILMSIKKDEFALKQTILSRMPLKECYQRFYAWNTTFGAKRAIPYRERYLQGWHLNSAEYGTHRGTYKGALIEMERFWLQSISHIAGSLPPRGMATEEDLAQVKDIVERFGLNTTFGSRSLDEWYDEFFREPGHYYQLLRGLELKVLENSFAYLSEDAAKDKLFEPLNEYLQFIAWLPVPEKASSEEIKYAFQWTFPRNRAWLFDNDDTSDMGITMLEYAEAGSKKLQQEAGKTID